MGDIRALGIDAGSTTTKIVGVDSAGALIWHLMDRTDPKGDEQIRAMIADGEVAAGGTVPIVATGYGRKLATGVDRAVTEITCHARGVFRALGRPGTLVDIGGQDSKVIRIGGKGTVADFAMNDKCAAGTGRFFENVAYRLRIDLSELDEYALSTTLETPISSTCTVFAESEIISMLARGTELAPILRGVHRALVRRVAAMARAIGVQGDLFLSGGVARNRAVQAMLAEELGGDYVTVPEHAQLMGAYGAALTALAG
jgi:(R)-2-hydroxyacyl-CoA dehydratese activating ATPase